MLKNSGQTPSSFSPIDSLKFSTFNYFGMGAVLASVAQSFWINFSAYYLNNILPEYGNYIFLVAQIFEGIGILLGWLVLAKFSKRREENDLNNQNKKCKFDCFNGISLYMFIYILGAFMLMIFLPLVFLLPLSSPVSVFGFSILAKIGSGFMIISQLTIIPKITLNRSRRRKLVEKVTQYGLAGTFVAMFAMTFVSIYVTFIWKYFIGVCGFVVVGGVCSIIYVYKIRQLVITSGFEEKLKLSSKITYSNNSQQKSEHPTQGIVQCSLLKTLKFYLYAIVLIFCTLYMDIVIAIYPYFIKSFQNITHFRYLSAITILYLSSFMCSLLTKNAFVFSSIRTVMSIGLVSCVISSVFFIICLADRQFDTLMILGTCLTGISKVVATNCVLNMINQFIGKNVQGREFIYGFYYFFEKIITGFVLFILIQRVYVSEDVQFLHFSEIYLPLILYSVSWLLVMIDRTLMQRTKNYHIVIVEPDKQAQRKISEDLSQNDGKGQNHERMDQEQIKISSKIGQKSKIQVKKSKCVQA